jgi:hypothetical protein
MSALGMTPWHTERGGVMKSLFLVLLVCCFSFLLASPARAQDCDASLAYVFPSANWVQPPGWQAIHVLSHCSEGGYTYLQVRFPGARGDTQLNLYDSYSGAHTGWNIWWVDINFTHLGEYTNLRLFLDGQLIPGSGTDFVVEDGAPPFQLTVVHGIVRSDTGSPLAGVPVTVVEQDGSTHSMNTRSDGSYALQWEQGDSAQVWIEPPVGYDCADPAGCVADLVPPYDDDYGLKHRVVDFTLTGAMAVEGATWGGIKSEYR